MMGNRWLLIAVTALLLLVLVAYGWHRYKFPYGGSHRCIRSLHLSLTSYAMAHDGQYPTSEDGPAQSLALLIPERAPVDLVCGKSINPDEAKRYFQEHGTLSEEFCGWGYRPGLTTDDDSRIAILWDKIPLGHNGQRTRDSSREVALLGGSLEVVPEAEWDEFLNHQAELLSKREPEEG